MDGISKYLLFLTGVGGWFWITLTSEKKMRDFDATRNHSLSQLPLKLMTGIFDGK